MLSVGDYTLRVQKSRSLRQCSGQFVRFQVTLSNTLTEVASRISLGDWSRGRLGAASTDDSTVA